MTTRPLHVLVVDDSAVVREVMLAALRLAGGMTVATAADPIIARRRIAAERPDVIVLDLEMPREDGLTFLRDLMATDPIPVVVCSSHGTAGSMPALAALQAGAVEVVAKPHISLREFVQESALLLTDAVRAAAHARRRPIRRVAAPVARAATRAAWSPSSCIIAMAASTGGPQALEEVLSVLPPESPGIVVVQHMPPGFTKAFAAHLDRVCALEVKEAAHGDAIVDGRVLIAPGDHHLLVRRKDGHHVVTVTGGPLVTRHRPSADVLFQSVAESVGAAAFGVIMTGMGSDGARGIAAMKTAGATTVAQDEESCVVFGMPKEAVARGAVDETVPLGEIAERIRLWKPNFGRGDELQRAVV